MSRNFNKLTKKIIRYARLSPSPPWYAQFCRNSTKELIIVNIIIIFFCKIFTYTEIIVKKACADIKAYSNNTIFYKCSINYSVKKTLKLQHKWTKVIYFRLLVSNMSEIVNVGAITTYS